MRTPPMLRVEVDGAVVFRPAAPNTIQCGAGVIVNMGPQLEAGEILVERIGMLPIIVKEKHMVDDREQREMYRDEMVRAVMGACPAIQAKEANPIALGSLSRQLVDAENAKALLRANGYGRHTDSITDMVRTLITGERKRA